LWTPQQSKVGLSWVVDSQVRMDLHVNARFGCGPQETDRTYAFEVKLGEVADSKASLG
jgi:hypothetical protein